MNKPGWENPVRMAECKLCGKPAMCQVYFGASGNNVVAFMACNKCIAETYAREKTEKKGENI